MRPTIALALSLVLARIMTSAWPIVICVMALAFWAWYCKRPSYRDRYLTDSIVKDKVTNLRGVPFDDFLDDNPDFQRNRAEVNNRLAMQNNEGTGPYIPDK